MLRSEGSFFLRYQAGVAKHVHVIALNRCQIRSRFYRFHWCLSMDQNQSGTRVPCPLDGIRNGSWRKMGQFHSWKDKYPPLLLCQATILREAIHELIYSTDSDVVSYSHRRIAIDVSAPNELNRRENAVTEKRLGLEIVEHDRAQHSIGLHEEVST